MKLLKIADCKVPATFEPLSPRDFIMGFNPQDITDALAEYLGFDINLNELSFATFKNPIDQYSVVKDGACCYHFLHAPLPLNNADMKKGETVLFRYYERYCYGRVTLVSKEKCFVRMTGNYLNGKVNLLSPARCRDITVYIKDMTRFEEVPTLEELNKSIIETPGDGKTFDSGVVEEAIKNLGRAAQNAGIIKTYHAPYDAFTPINKEEERPDIEALNEENEPVHLSPDQISHISEYVGGMRSVVLKESDKQATWSISFCYIQKWGDSALYTVNKDGQLIKSKYSYWQ